ncbi:hypothetical protein BHU72_03605 [Desulfuribacillus stibiiarsenatis]|uniref:Uncharacterized protein n=1 Tax=Desulfuribacillus stibiiarsenatis TaxID=1390249 RepID=A0A1E5L6V1_9FIRM|nr:hypothetical protein [Desulfuribacillus stibiiarsenatis]OEH85875.1 hypothetical protein BHU72_03605 [Desulfuribacillus stibiiarsenatis]
MNSYDTNYSYSTLGQVNDTTKREKPKNRKNITYIMLTVLFWLALVLGGMYAAKSYVESRNQIFLNQMNEIKQSNEMLTISIKEEFDTFKEEMAQVHKELTVINGELNIIKEELQLTGQSVAGSNNSKNALADRMTELDRQLVELRKQLKKLEDAARVY